MGFLSNLFLWFAICSVPCVIHAAVRRYRGEIVGGAIFLALSVALAVGFAALDAAIG